MGGHVRHERAFWLVGWCVGGLVGHKLVLQLVEYFVFGLVSWSSLFSHRKWLPRTLEYGCWWHTLASWSVGIRSTWDYWGYTVGLLDY